MHAKNNVFNYFYCLIYKFSLDTCFFIKIAKEILVIKFLNYSKKKT